MCTQFNNFKYRYLSLLILFNISRLFERSKIVKQFYLIHSIQVQQLRIGEDLGVMTMKGYSRFSKAPGLEPHHRMQFIVIFRTLIVEGSLPSAEM